MAMIQDASAAALGLLVDYAMDMYTSPAGRQTMAPPADARLAPTWVLRGYICGVDALLHTKSSMQLGQDHVCFGYLAEMAQTPGTFVAVIRGTDGFLEWIEDAEFLLIGYAKKGMVEQGFYDIYETMQFRTAQGDMVSLPDGIASVVGGGTLTVVGHSLGSALATYLTLDLADPARLGARVSACLFASPQPGDHAFAALFDATVADYKLYNYELDAVPRIPRGPDYTSLSKAVWINPKQAQAHIRFDLACHHHVVCYCAMLDYSLIDWTTFPKQDQPCTACIRGPTAA